MRRRFRSVEGGKAVRRHWRGAGDQPVCDDKRERWVLPDEPPKDAMNWPLVGALSLIAVSVGGYVGIEWAKQDAPPVAVERPVAVNEVERRRGLSAAEIAAIETGEREPVASEMDEAIEASSGAVAAPSTAPAAVHFSMCHTGGGTNCVVDGDTIWMNGSKIRILNIDAPETHPPRCAEEDRLGRAATRRLQELLNSGVVEAASSGSRDRDTYGRKLRVVRVNGEDVGSVLVSEGLARWYSSGRRSWC